MQSRPTRQHRNHTSSFQVQASLGRVALQLRHAPRIDILSCLGPRDAILSPAGSQSPICSPASASGHAQRKSCKPSAHAARAPRAPICPSHPIPQIPTLLAYFPHNQSSRPRSHATHTQTATRLGNQSLLVGSAATKPRQSRSPLDVRPEGQRPPASRLLFLIRPWGS